MSAALFLCASAVSAQESQALPSTQSVPTPSAPPTPAAAPLPATGSPAPLATDPALAAELFSQGRAAMSEGQYDIACSKFAESFRLDPHVGSAINLADCEVAAGHLAMARTHFQEAMAVAHSLGDPRESFAAERLAAIDPRVPRLTLRPGKSFRPEATVTKDDVPVGAINLGTPLPVEVGKHVVTVSAPGFLPKSVTTTLAESDNQEVVLDLGEPLPPPPASEAVSGAHGMSTLRKVALGSGAVGAAAVVVGAGLGIAVIAARGQPSGTCNPTCDANANARNLALAEGDASTGLFVAGGALLATAAVLWFIPTSRAPRTGLRVAPGVGARTLSVLGTF